MTGSLKKSHSYLKIKINVIINNTYQKTMAQIVEIQREFHHGLLFFHQKLLIYYKWLNILLIRCNLWKYITFKKKIEDEQNCYKEKRKIRKVLKFHRKIRNKLSKKPNDEIKHKKHDKKRDCFYEWIQTIRKKYNCMGMMKNRKEKNDRRGKHCSLFVLCMMICISHFIKDIQEAFELSFYFSPINNIKLVILVIYSPYKQLFLVINAPWNNRRSCEKNN